MGIFQHDLEVVVGQNVKAAREALQWKQSDLAERVGVARSTIAKLEVGGPITVSTLSSIANIFGIPPYMLMLRTIDLRRIANIPTWQEKIEKYRNSKEYKINSDYIESIQEMSTSTIKSKRREATTETNHVVAQILGVNTDLNNKYMENFEKSRTAGTAIATSRLPTYPIVNGLIANLIVS